MSTIEDLWRALGTSAMGSRQRRIDPSHPLDLYADFEPPNHPGLVAVCGIPAIDVHPLRAISIVQGERDDRRWSLRLGLQEALLLPVFAALCSDIIASTRTGVTEVDLAAAVISRIERWRTLLEGDNSGLGESVLRGLIGELFVLETHLLPMLPARAAVGAWKGPEGGPQDFLLPSGLHLEVKTIAPSSSSVRINGLSQLDAGDDPLALLVLRAETTGMDAPGAVSAPLLIERVRRLLVPDSEAVQTFDEKLACLGWHAHPSHDAVALRMLSIEEHSVETTFPRLVPGSVPAGIVDADYLVALPPPGRTLWRRTP